MFKHNVILALYIFLLLCINFISRRFHGGLFLALKGSDSIVLISDGRFSSQAAGKNVFQGITTRGILSVSTKVLLCFYGLESDIYVMRDRLRYSLRDQSDDSIDPNVISHVVSNILYDIPLLCAPIIIGFDFNNEPYICSTDSIGAKTMLTSFTTSGTSSSALYAICEDLYRENLDSKELQKLGLRCVHKALQRDLVSGCQMQMITMKKRKDTKEQDEVEDNIENEFEIQKFYVTDV